MMVLELDSGNTRLKWRLKHGDAIVKSGAIENDYIAEQLPELCKKWKTVSRVVGAAVSDVALKSRMESIINDELSVKVHWVVTSDSAPVKPLYDGLGVDRWLAMNGAYTIDHCAKLVVSCGTATTIDSVNVKGEHEGGFILPGLAMMRDSLLSNTAGVRCEVAPFEAIAMGQNTQECVTHGALFSLVATITALQQCNPNYVVYLTGGNADAVKAHLHGEVIVKPDLVMDGLAVVTSADQEH